MNPEHILAMFLTGLVGLCVYRLVEIIRESEAEADARVHRNMREMWQRLEEDQRRDIEQFNLTQLEAKLDELRQKRDQIILDALSKAEKEKRKKDDELTEIAQKCKYPIPELYASGLLTEQERQLFYDSLAQELREYWLTQDEDKGGHGHMTFREKLAQEHPDHEGQGCPCDYGYEKLEREYGQCPRPEQVGGCFACWNREMPEPEPKTNDPVNHPAHYTAGKIEVIDCIESMIAPIKDPEQAFLAGQVLKYIARYSLKNGVEDLRKSKWYLERLIRKVGE